MIVTSDRIIRLFNWLFRSDINAMALWPFIILSSESVVDDELLNHERIHLMQQLELLIIPFYVWYLISMWVNGYMNISFEREAYENDSNLSYLKSRRPYSFLKYARRK